MKLNRSAAGHLALVISVLLCFFVYIGYRFLGSSDQPTDTAAPITQLQPQDSPSTTIGSLLEQQPPAVQKTDVTIPLHDTPVQNIMPAPPADTPVSAPAPGGLALAVPPSASTPTKQPEASFMPAPAGSVEETSVSSMPGAITGLTPAPASTAEDDAMERDDTRSVSPAGSLSLTVPETAPVAGKPQQSTVPQPPVPTPPAPARTAPTPPPPAPVAPVAAARPQQPKPQQQTNSELRMYVIEPGDTLSRIASRELGSIALADNIFLLNRDVIASPDQLVVGTRIRLPVNINVETRPSTETFTMPERDAGVIQPRQPRAAGVRMHRVVRGDTLSSIALYYYGSSSSWNAIFEANREQLPNPNRLRVGMELIIPSLAE